jgi:hypothetical protein
MDKLTFCNNYLYSYGQVIFIFVDKLSLLWCLFCLRRYVCWLCLYVEMEAMRDGSSWPVNEDNSKETIINKPPSHLCTNVTLPLHGGWMLLDFNYWALKLETGVKCSSVTDFIARYQYGVISNELKQPVTDRALISNGLY